jgi:hypothetical protein
VAFGPSAFGVAIAPTLLPTLADNVPNAATPLKAARISIVSVLVPVALAAALRLET